MDNKENDAIITNAYTLESDGVVDIIINDGVVSDIVGSTSQSGAVEIDAAGDLVSPGLCECHLHMDKATIAAGGREPPYNETSPTLEDIIQNNQEFFAEATASEIEGNVRDLVEWGVTHGVLYYRSQTYTGGTAGLEAVHGVARAKERLSSLSDIQLVAFPQDGIWYEDNEQWLREALTEGADILGGIDPAAQNSDVKRTVDTWFDIAGTHGVPLDVHVHEPESLGMYTMNYISESTVEHGMEGDVTISHAFGLAEINETPDYHVSAYEDGTLEPALDRFSAADVKFVTCYPSTRPSMPVREMLEAGLAVGLATDNVQTYTDPRQSPNLLHGALVEAYKLDQHGRSYLTNPSLRKLWDTMTYEAATVLGRSDSYGIQVGNPADMVVFDEPSPQRAIINQASAEYVLKDGTVIVEDGELQSPAA